MKAACSRWENIASPKRIINTAATLYRALAGFLIAAIAGIALGAAMARNRLARWFFDPIVSVGFPMPKIAFLPVVILWLGLYDVSKISMVVLDAIFPVVTATMAGIAGVEKELLWSARNMGAKYRQLMGQILLPAAKRQLLMLLNDLLAMLAGALQANLLCNGHRRLVRRALAAGAVG